MRLLVCGSRDWTDDIAVEAVIKYFEPTVICQGEARGADLIAKSIAIKLGIDFVGYKADWKTYGKGAGPVRNTRMLKQFRPDVVVAFKDGFQRSLKYGGTEHMCKISLEASKSVFLVRHVRGNNGVWRVEPLL